jgi:wobble nucleotide-excising tRNase
VKENVFPNEGTLPPVFVLGEKSIQTQKDLDNTKIQLKAVELDLPNSNALSKKANEDFERFCADQAKAIKDALQVAGTDPYRNYNQAHYKKCVASFDQPQASAARALTDTRKAEIARLLTQQPLDSIQLLNAWVESAQIHEADIKALLGESVVAHVLDELKNNAELAVWIERGLSLHPEGDRAKCKFCGQSLPLQRIDELEGHFNDAVNNLKTRVMSKISLLEAAKSKLSRKLPSMLALYPQFQLSFQKGSEDFDQSRKVMEQEYDLMISLLQQKATNLFMSVAIPDTLPGLNNSTIESRNSIIDQHNAETVQLSTTKKRACEEWEHGAIFESHKEYTKKRLAVQDAADAVRELSERRQELSAKCKALEASLREHRRPAEELNSDLKSYLGHGDLSLEVHETGYNIMRGSSLADHLSEGERTAIAILYFLKSLEDSSFTLADGVVVIDDPISSLDERALFSAFSHIQNKTKGAGQVFILTHNFSFFRLVKRWFTSKNRRDDQGNQTVKAAFYMLECKAGQGDRTSTLSTLDKLLADYESDYQYLFSKVVEVARLSSSQNLEANYHIPNIARRLLESFLSFRFPYIKDNFRQLLEQTGFDPQKVDRIYRFCHAFSHADRIPGAEHDPNLLSETQDVMNDVLALMQYCDAGHYDGLMRVCNFR